MVSFFKHRSSPKGASESGFASDSLPGPEHQHRKDVQRDLILVVLKNTLHRLGIPHEWLTCEVIALGHAPDPEKLHIQLMLTKWHETLLRYGPALEQQLLRGLLRLDPTVDTTKYIVSWRFAPNCGCPFRVMPPPVVWANDEQPAASAQPVKQPHIALASLPSANDYYAGEYERTQLAPLR